MSSVSTPRFSAFLDAYNQGNTLPDAAADKFRVTTEADKKIIVTRLDDRDDDNALLLKEKIKQIDLVLNDQSPRGPRGYEKLMAAGNVLASISKELANEQDTAVKKSGLNVITSFLEAAQDTQDQQLLKIAYTIGKAAL